MLRKIIPWAGVTLVLVLIFGTIYGVVQQAQRSEANMPQIQIAEDTAASLNRGVPPTALTNGFVNMNKSLAPFIVIYDKSGKVVATTGLLNNKPPKAPIGILQASSSKEFNAVTWQPQQDLRFAAITVAANKYYVLSGRSLKQVEANESKSFNIAFMGGLATLIVVSVGFVLVSRL